MNRVRRLLVVQKKYKFKLLVKDRGFADFVEHQQKLNEPRRAFAEI